MAFLGKKGAILQHKLILTTIRDGGDSSQTYLTPAHHPNGDEDHNDYPHHEPNTKGPIFMSCTSIPLEDPIPWSPDNPHQDQSSRSSVTQGPIHHLSWRSKLIWWLWCHNCTAEDVPIPSHQLIRSFSHDRTHVGRVVRARGHTFARDKDNRCLW
jgi:hypothetical protein